MSCLDKLHQNNEKITKWAGKSLSAENVREWCPKHRIKTPLPWPRAFLMRGLTLPPPRLDLKISWRKCPRYTIFFHYSGTFSISFLGNTNVVLCVLCRSAGFILTTWTPSSVSLCEIVKLKLMKYIPQHLSISILKFPVFVFYQSGLSSATGIRVSWPEKRQIILVRYLHISGIKHLKFAYNSVKS